MILPIVVLSTIEGYSVDPSAIQFPRMTACVLKLMSYVQLVEFCLFSLKLARYFPMLLLIWPPQTSSLDIPPSVSRFTHSPCRVLHTLLPLS
jgi:hypothetical protein